MASYKHTSDVAFLHSWLVFTMPYNTLESFQRESKYFSHEEDAVAFGVDVQLEHTNEEFRIIQVKDEEMLEWLLTKDEMLC